MRAIIKMANEKEQDKEIRAPDLVEPKFGERPEELAATPKIFFKDIIKEIHGWLYPITSDDANIGVLTNVNNTPVMQLADGATKTAYFSFPWPRELSLGRTYLVWSSTSTINSAACTINIGVGGLADQNNERTTGGSTLYATADQFSVLSNDLNYTSFGEVGRDNNGGVSWGTLRPDFRDIVGIKLTRGGDGGDDTLAGVMNVYGILLSFY